MAQNVVASLAAVPTSGDMSSDTLPAVKPGLLPLVQLPPFKATTTATTRSAPATKSSPPKNTVSQVAPTTKAFLDATKFALSETHDGPYEISFTTDAGAYGKITWDLSKTTLTVGNPATNFSVSFTCDPPANLPAPGAMDESPTFSVKTSYVCAVNLAATTGNDKQPQTKPLSFTTGPGQLVITPPSSMNTILTDNTNVGGFVFKNDDAAPVTITGLDLDIAYQGLATFNGPLVMRLEDPSTEASLVDYHLEDLAADPSSANAHAGVSIHIPVSFTIGATSQKLLPVKILGVQRLSVMGVDPFISVAIRHVATNQNLNRIVLSAAKISWSCIVAVGGYNPSATTSPYATGQACR